MKNYIQQGNVLTITLDKAVSAGELLVIGALPVVACESLPANTQGDYNLTGVYEFAALPAAVGKVGMRAYWDVTRQQVTAEATGHSLIGVFWSEKMAASTTATVRLSGMPVAT